MTEELLEENILKLIEDDPELTIIDLTDLSFDRIEEIGKYIANNIHLEFIKIGDNEVPVIRSNIFNQLRELLIESRSTVPSEFTLGERLNPKTFRLIEMLNYGILNHGMIFEYRSRKNTTSGVLQADGRIEMVFPGSIRGFSVKTLSQFIEISTRESEKNRYDNIWINGEKYLSFREQAFVRLERIIDLRSVIDSFDTITLNFLYQERFIDHTTSFIYSDEDEMISGQWCDYEIIFDNGKRIRTLDELQTENLIINYERYHSFIDRVWRIIYSRAYYPVYNPKETRDREMKNAALRLRIELRSREGILAVYSAWSSLFPGEYSRFIAVISTGEIETVPLFEGFPVINFIISRKTEDRIFQPTYNEEINRVIDRIYTSLFNRHQYLTGLVQGDLYPQKGMIGSEEGICAFVLKADVIPTGETLIPKIVEGFKVKICEGYYAPTAIIGRKNPIYPGCSIGKNLTLEPYAGSIGCFVRESGSTETYVLTAGHIPQTIGKTIVHPAVQDTCESENIVIGITIHCLDNVPVIWRSSTYGIDGALIKIRDIPVTNLLPDRDELLRGTIDTYSLISILSQIQRPPVEQTLSVKRLIKIGQLDCFFNGRSSGIGKVKLLSIHGIVRPLFMEETKKGNALPQTIWVEGKGRTPFIGGDSGSLVRSLFDNGPVGIVSGNFYSKVLTKDIGIIIPIDPLFGTDDNPGVFGMTLKMV